MPSAQPLDVPFARRAALGACVLFAFAWLAGAAHAQQPTSLVTVTAETRELLELGVALEHAERQNGRTTFAATPWEREQLERAGVAYRVVVPDLEAFYAARLRAESELWAGSNPADAPGFGFGSMGGYYTWSEMVAKLDEMRANYPALVSAKQSLGLSHEGRPIWMAKISDHADSQDEDEPAILFTGLTHAREPIGMEVNLHTMFHLLERYGIDPEVTYLVDTRELYFVPVVNPDGYVYNQGNSPNGGGLWRKNRRNSGGGAFGVDLNRNWGYQWGFDNTGSSPQPSSDTYRGPGPFSEPEISALRALHGRRTLTTAFHYHAYGGYEIHPFAYLANAFPPAGDLTLYQRFGVALNALNGYQVGNFWNTLGYLANGEAIDWSYGEQVEKAKVFAFLPEVGTSSDGFWPPASRIVPLCELHRAPNLYWAWIAGASGELLHATAGVTVPAGGTGDVVAQVENRGLGAAAADLRVAVSSSDPYVSIPVPAKVFPVLAPLALGNNAADPVQFSVAPNAPTGHMIVFTVRLYQGPVLRGTRITQATVQ
jgi:hypothetical protein